MPAGGDRMEGELRIRVLRPDQPEALLARRVAQVHAALLEELLPELAPTPEEQAERHNIAVRSDDRILYRQTLHMVGNITCTCTAGTLCLVGIVILQAEVIPISHCKIGVACRSVKG